jgi:formamidopyrimidine-DNA glycosylase
MPELPEITKLAQQVKTHLVGKTIANIEVLQPKCLNMPVEAFCAALTGAQILDASNRGKWIVMETTRGWLLVNLGMGGELLLTTRAALPEKYRLIFDLTDGSCVSINFWWFGYVHYAAPDALERHEMVGKLGPNALDLDGSDLRNLMAGRRGTVKSFLLDQSRIAGIGNSYVHDILFLARLHPLRKIESLQEDDFHALARGIHDRLQSSLDKGGAFYEVDLFGQKGGFTMEELLVGYREGQPCPQCGTPIEKIKTGGTSGFLCPSCQSLDPTR